MKIKLMLSGFIVCALLLASSAWAAPEASTILWNFLGGGGGRVVNGSVTLEGTLAQSVTGPVAQGAASLCSGYWCGSEEIYLPGMTIYLPVVIRH